MTSPSQKYRYEYPPMEAHFLLAPNVDSAAAYLRRTYPHNIDQVLPTLVRVPAWPEFYKTLDHDGRVLPKKSES